jgi:hypothetical protein
METLKLSAEKPMHLKSWYCDLIYSSTSFLATIETILGQKSRYDVLWDTLNVHYANYDWTNPKSYQAQLFEECFGRGLSGGT